MTSNISTTRYESTGNSVVGERSYPRRPRHDLRNITIIRGDGNNAARYQLDASSDVQTWSEVTNSATNLAAPAFPASLGFPGIELGSHSALISWATSGMGATGNIAFTRSPLFAGVATVETVYANSLPLISIEFDHYDSISPAINARVEALKLSAAEEEIEINGSSQDQLIANLRLLNTSKIPNIFLLDNGNYRAVWVQGREQIGLEFLGDGTVRFVLIANRQQPIGFARSIGLDDAHHIANHISALGIGHLIYDEG